MRSIFAVSLAVGLGIVSAAGGGAEAEAKPASGPASQKPIELPLTISTVDVSHNTARRFGAPHIAVNPKNPNNIIVLASMSLGYTKACLPAKPGSDCEMVSISIPGMPMAPKQARGFARTRGFSDIGVFVSFDRGRTFKHVDVSGIVAPNDPRVSAKGEGPIVVTADGTFYIAFNAINWGNWESEPKTFFPNGGVGVIRSRDGGQSWEWASYTGTPGDWPYGGLDPTNGTFYVTSGIAGLTALGPRSTGDEHAPTGKLTERWVASTRDGTHWTEPQPLGGDDGARHAGAGHSSIAAAFGTMATLFVSRSAEDCAFFLKGEAQTNCIVFQTSTDAGKTWTRSRVPIPAGFSAEPYSLFVAADPARRDHFTATLLNKSGADFLVYRTPDAGKTWSAPVTLTEDANKHHFASYVAFSPKGEFGVMWRTHEPDPAKPGAKPAELPYSVWAAISRDGGATFSRPLKVSTANSPAAPTDPNDAFRIIGDHGPSGLAIDGFGAVHVVWADWSPGERGIYLSSINMKAFGK